MVFSRRHTTIVFPRKFSTDSPKCLEGSNFTYASLYELVVLYFEF